MLHPSTERRPTGRQEGRLVRDSADSGQLTYIAHPVA
jgi:hypothetical protein